MARWWKVSVDTKARKQINKTLERLGTEVATGDARSFLRPLVEDHRGMALYFDELFTKRGDGGTAFGNSWKPLSSRWLKAKERSGFDTRIGFFKTPLFDSLATTDGDGKSVTLTKRTALYGTSVKYAKYFNASRPLIAPGDGEQVRQFFIDGNGRVVFDQAVAAYREQVVSQVLSESNPAQNRFLK